MPCRRPGAPVTDLHVCACHFSHMPRESHRIHKSGVNVAPIWGRTGTAELIFHTQNEHEIWRLLVYFFVGDNTLPLGVVPHAVCVRNQNKFALMLQKSGLMSPGSVLEDLLWGGKKWARAGVKQSGDMRGVGSPTPRRDPSPPVPPSRSLSTPSCTWAIKHRQVLVLLPLIKRPISDITTQRGKMHIHHHLVHDLLSTVAILLASLWIIILLSSTFIMSVCCLEAIFNNLFKKKPRPWWMLLNLWWRT